MTTSRASSAPVAARPGPPADLPTAVAALTVLLQVCYPLVHGRARDALTVLTVVVFFLAGAVHAWIRRGPGWAAALVAVTAGTGLLAEAVGTATGYPFGSYTYADSLGPAVLGVPLVVPLAWSMMAYPALLAGQRVSTRRVPAALVGAGLLAGWDLFLDPQMVQAGHWRWTSVTSALPGIPEIPVSNFAGWAAVALLMLGVLQALPRRPADDRQPAALLLWTYASSVLASAVFFGRPAVALVGGLGMGAFVLPFVRSLRR